ncbi:acyl carrier protein [Streptomyces sp. SID14478]|uniref:acyl carrier protein n=1 Tax=Streptomyces sp. SID14478 TaxID=2706073 RepID=UPI0013DD1229|nr:acyl carrier protein [Streptomyces sp. SID14478]NEB75935.1 acyl carrier protein [Streptomyces sp. SID14478]
MTTAAYDMLVTKLTQDLGVDAALIQPEATFADLEVDSLAALELGVILEEDFKIKFDLEELRREDMTLGQFTRHVERLLAQAASTPAGAA